MKKPNVVILMVDQLNYRDLGYMNHPVLKTPNLDALRHDSVNFSQCYVQNAFCLPSRACYLTGQYLFNHRQYGFTGLMDEATPSMPAYFRDHGYYTFHVGKLHVNPFGENIGFDTLIPTLPEDICRSTDFSRNFLVHCNGGNWPYPTDQIHGDDFQFPGIKKELKNAWFTGVSDIPAEASLERYTADQAIAFIQSPHEKPFLAHISFDRPHGPWTPSPEYAERYPPEAIPLPDELVEDELNRMPEHIRQAITDGHFTVRKIGPDTMRKTLSLYYGLMTQIDDEVGRILDTLKKEGLYDDTIIVFCADHGDMAGHKGLFDKYSNRIYHDDIIRTPMLLKLPDQQKGGLDVSRTTESIDIFPTLCELCSISTEALPLDGSSLVSLTADPGDAHWDDRAFSESYSIKALIKDGWKFIYYVNSDEAELYDLAKDPDERNNLYGTPGTEGTVLTMKAEIVKTMTKPVSDRRKTYIRSLFDDRETRKIGAMGPLFKWEKGIVEGGGFWMLFRNKKRLTYIPFDDELRFEELDPQDKTDGITWNYLPCSDQTALHAALDELINYISTKIRPISIMIGNQDIWDKMLQTKGAGLC